MNEAICETKKLIIGKVNCIQQCRAPSGLRCAKLRVVAGYQKRKDYIACVIFVKSRPVFFLYGYWIVSFLIFFGAKIFDIFILIKHIGFLTTG